MANERAQAAKEKGNAAFKIGDYPNAIGHYTAAILADRKDPTFPLNRAAAYLKLGKNEDAERDCSIVLDLSPNNVKALFRRGQARLGAGKVVEAQSDLTQALTLEPGNAAVKEELTKLADILARTKAKGKATATSTVQSGSSESTAHPKRRRVPITIVEPLGVSSAKTKNTPLTQSTSESQSPAAAVPSPPKPDIDTLQPVSTRSLKPSSTSTTSTPTGTLPTASPSPATPQPQPKPTSFKEAKQARETAKPSRVGGGIFRASGASTIFPTRESSSPPDKTNGSTSKGDVVTENGETASAVQTTSPQVVVEAPANLFELVKAWGSAVNVDEKWQLINSIPPASIPSLCKTSLEPAMLVSILEVFLAMLNVNTSVKIQEYMDNLARVPRFGTLVLFLSKEEKEVARDIWRVLGVERPTGVWSVVA